MAEGERTGRVAELGRFPVKSMLGEGPSSVEVGEVGVVGDRVFALIDDETGKVASAKRPNRFASALGIRATYVDAVGPGEPLRFDLPDGSQVDSNAPDLDARLSTVIGRSVHLARAGEANATYEYEWADIEGVAPDEFIAESTTSTSDAGLPVSTLGAGGLAPGTYQDLAPLTLMTTASLSEAARLTPASEWDPRRFRSNILIDVDGEGFVENDWVGRTVEIGDVAIGILAPTPRCVMTTLAQADLPADRAVLQTVARHNRLDVGDGRVFACLGVYGFVAQGGRLAVDDEVFLR
jgi:uncharacterized protein YcbX